MRKFAFVSLLFYCFLSGVWGADAPPRQPLQIQQLGGVDFSINPFMLKPGQAILALNLDLSEMSIRQRDGFSVLRDNSRINDGIFSFIDRNGDKRLLTYMGPIQTDIGNSILWSDPYGYTMADTSFYGHYYEGGWPSWVAMNGIAVFANGYDRPQRFNGANVRPLAPLGPGAIELSPVKANATSRTNGDVLDGDYYYAVRYTLPCDSNTYGPLVVTNYQIHVDSDQVAFYAYNTTAYSSICTSPSNTAYQLARTKAGGTLRDIFYLVQPDSILTTSVFIDSIPDASLGGSLGTLDTTQITADTTSDTDYRIAAIDWISTDTNGLNWVGMSRELDSLSAVEWTHTHYFMTYYDSSTGMESDSGLNTRIPVAYRGTENGFWDGGIRFDDTTQCTGVCDSATYDDSTLYDYSIELSLTRTNTFNGHLWRILYKGRETKALVNVPDSMWEANDVPPDTIIGSSTDDIGNPDAKKHLYCPPRYSFVTVWDENRTNAKIVCRQGGWNSYDSTAEYINVGPFYAIDTIKNNDDTTYVDSTYWASITATLPAWNGGQKAVGQWNYPTIYNNRLYMARGNRVFYSVTGHIAQFAFGSAFDISPYDGDEITGMLTTGDGLMVFKNKSMWLAQWNNSLGIHIKTKIRDIGCIAPHSIIDLPVGGYAFLSELGVQAFSTHYQSMYKSSGGNFGDISRPIKEALDKYSINDRRECHAWLTPDYEQLAFSLPTLDSSWVYSLATGQWNVWNFSTRQTTRYDTTYQTDLRPSNDVLFIGNASDSIFKYGGVKTDTGKAIDIAWKSGPLFRNPVKDGVIDKFAIWKESNDTAGINVVFWDWRGDSIISFTDSTQWYFQQVLTALNDPKHGYQFEINTTGLSVDSLTIYEIDLWYLPFGEPTEK